MSQFNLFIVRVSISQLFIKLSDKINDASASAFRPQTSTILIYLLAVTFTPTEYAFKSIRLLSAMQYSVFQPLESECVSSLVTSLYASSSTHYSRLQWCPDT